MTFPLLLGGLVGFAPSAGAGQEQSRSKAVDVRAAKVTLDIPTRWRRLDLSKRDLKAITEAIEEQNPQLAENLDPSYAKALKFYAQDFVDGDAVEVSASPGRFPSRSSLEQSLEAGLAEVPGFELVSVEPLKVGSSKALRARFRHELTTPAGDVVPVYRDELVMRRDGFAITGVLVTVDDEPADIRIADDIITSVRPLGAKRAKTGREEERPVPLAAALTEVTGFRAEDAPEAIDAFRQALLASNDLPAGEDIVALKHYLRDDGTDAYAYVLGRSDVQLRRPVTGGCATPASGEVVTLAGQSVCRQQFDSQWILSWGSGDFTLRVLSTSSPTAEALMTALVVANAA